MLNTAMAAEKVAKEGDRTQAAIASRYAAEHFGLNILAEGCLSGESNSTRFIIISNQKCFDRNAGKISICIEMCIRDRDRREATVSGSMRMRRGRCFREPG